MLHEVAGTDPVSFLIRFERQTSELLQEIKPGQVVTGTIVKATPKGYIANFAGKNLLLDTAAYFEEGQAVRAELVQHEGAWHLRLIQANAPPASAAADENAIVDQQVADLLARLGLEATTENSIAARWLVNAGLPASRMLLESLALLLSGRTSFEAELVHLTQLLRGLMPRFTDARLADTLKEIIAAFERATAAPTESGLATNLRSFLADSGIFMESKMKMLLQSGTTSDERQQIAGDLKFALLRLRSLIASRQFRQMVGANTSKELALYVSNALKLVRGQQAQNLIESGLNQLLVHIPFLSEWGFEHVRLHFYCERDTPEGKRPRSYAVAVELSTSNLGRLRIVFRLLGDKVHCHFTAEREPVAELLRAESPRLRERLEALRFSVGRITCGVGACEDGPPSDAQWNPPFWRTVDVKA
jgi:hypothetical protein